MQSETYLQGKHKKWNQTKKPRNSGHLMLLDIKNKLAIWNRQLIIEVSGQQLPYLCVHLNTDLTHLKSYWIPRENVRYLYYSILCKLEHYQVPPLIIPLTVYDTILISKQTFWISKLK